jgi:ABC-2 type transport system ATP-binding protein
MPANEYLDFFGQIYGLDAATRRARANALMETFGLLKDSRRRIAEYSKGMRQKLALVRAMLHDPPVLLLDEPTSAMDPESARLVRDSIQELRSASRAIIICTHNLAEAEELADHIAIIRQGKIVASGAPAQLKRDLLGPVEYEVHVGALLNGQPIPLAAGAELTGRGANWIRFRAARPEIANPVLLQSLLSQGLPVISIQEMPRSLEQVYLQVMNTSRAEEERVNA